MDRLPRFVRDVLSFFDRARKKESTKEKNPGSPYLIKAGSVLAAVVLIGLSARTTAPCVGSVEIYHAAGDVTGEATVILPDRCHFGRFFLTAESLEEGKAVVVNGWLHQGDLVIRTTHLEPPVGPVTTVVNYQVLP